MYRQSYLVAEEMEEMRAIAASAAAVAIQFWSASGRAFKSLITNYRQTVRDIKKQADKCVQGYLYMLCYTFL